MLLSYIKQINRVIGKNLYPFPSTRSFWPLHEPREEMILHLVAKNKLGDTSIAREAQDLARPVVLGAILTTYG